jgi:ribosome-binding factor A
VTRRRRSPRTTPRQYPRSARLNQLIQEIVAEEIERIEDERLGFFTVVAVEVEGDLERAIVWYSALRPDGTPVTEPDEDMAAALEEHRRVLQSAINRQTRIKRTPTLVFRPDQVEQSAARLEAILRDIAPE